MDDRIEGDTYRVTPAEHAQFVDQGYVHLRGLLTAAEVAELASTYDRFLRREIEVPGKDYCDMAGDYGREPEDFSIVNVMLPRRYHPAWQGNVFERRAASVAEQLCGRGMAIDYDQLLAKQPHKADAVFAWHQDMAYWPETPDTRTATVWLAIDASTLDNGCMRFVPATNHEGHLRPHTPMLNDRGESHALGTELRPDDVVVPTPDLGGGRHGAQRTGPARLGRQHHRRLPPGLRPGLPVRARRSPPSAGWGSPTATTTTTPCSTRSGSPVRADE